LFTHTHTHTHTHIYIYIYIYIYGPGSVVGIATGSGGRSGDRIPVVTRFSAPVQTGPGTHPASCTMGTGSFPGVKSGRGVALTTHPLLVPWSRKSRAIPLLPYGPYGLYRASVPVQRCLLPLIYINHALTTLDRQLRTVFPQLMLTQRHCNILTISLMYILLSHFWCNNVIFSFYFTCKG